MSFGGIHQTMMRTLERHALESDQAPTTLRRKKLSKTAFMKKSCSSLLASSLDEVQPLRRMKRALADERARRRRHEVAQREPCIFDAFAIAEGVDDLIIEKDPPGLKTTRWLEPPDAKEAREDLDAAEARALHKMERAAVFFARGSGFDGWSGKGGQLQPSAAFVAFEGGDFLKTDLARRIRISTNVVLTKAEARALGDRFEVDEKYFDGPQFVQWFFAQGFTLRMVELNRLQAVAERKKKAAASAVNVYDEARHAHRYRNVTEAFTEEDDRTAREKLRKVAANRGLVGDVAARRQFDSTMTPAELRDQLKKSYGLDMTRAEMGAVFAAFDKSARNARDRPDGHIDGAEFTYGWTRFLDDARTLAHAQQEKELSRRTMLHAPPSMDMLEEGNIDETASFVALHDPSRKKDAVRLSFPMSEVGAKSSEPAKHLVHRYSVTREQKALRELGVASRGVPHVQQRPSSLVLSPCVKPRPLVRKRSLLKEQSTPEQGKLATTRSDLPRRSGSFRRPTTAQLIESATTTPKTGRRRLTSAADAVAFHGGNLDLRVDRDVRTPPARRISIHRPKTPFESRAAEALLQQPSPV